MALSVGALDDASRKLRKLQEARGEEEDDDDDDEEEEKVPEDKVPDVEDVSGERGGRTESRDMQA